MMTQLFISLFLVFILLSGYICQTITPRISLASTTDKALNEIGRPPLTFHPR